MPNGNPRFDMRALLRVALSAGMLACASAMMAQESAAKSVFLKYMEQSRFVEYTAIRTQLSGCDDLGGLQLKVQNNSAGQQRITVLAPLAIQGQVFLDDGERYVQFFPDENRLYVTKSPSFYLPSPKERLALAEKNYRFSLTKGSSIAGRKVVYVVATPHEDDMPVRRFGIDEKTSVILKMETVQSGRATVTLDTKAIEYQPSGSLGELRIQPATGVRTITVSEPVRVTSNSVAAALTGIVPVIPPSLPAGFWAREPEILGTPREQFIAVRITDGLATATIYQFSTKGAARNAPLPSGSVENTYGNIRFAVAGDLPKTVMHKLLKTFILEASKNSSTYTGATRNSVGDGSRLVGVKDAPPSKGSRPTISSGSAQAGG